MFCSLTYLDPRRVTVPLQLLVTTKQRENVAVIYKGLSKHEKGLSKHEKGLSEYEKGLSDLNHTKMYRQFITKGSKILYNDIIHCQ